MSPELQVFIPTRYDIATGFNTSSLDTIQLMQFTAARTDKNPSVPYARYYRKKSLTILLLLYNVILLCHA